MEKVSKKDLVIWCLIAQFF